jgi:hypothetical protein
MMGSKKCRYLAMIYTPILFPLFLFIYYRSSRQVYFRFYMITTNVKGQENPLNILTHFLTNLPDWSMLLSKLSGRSQQWK